MRQTEPLLFGTPTFHDGLNITVRAGDKWAKLLVLGDTIELRAVSMDGSPGDLVHPTDAEIIGVRAFASLIDIPPRLLRHQHDPTCIDRFGLLKAMEAVYPDYDARAQVTVIAFLIE